MPSANTHASPRWYTLDGLAPASLRTSSNPVRSRPAAKAALHGLTSELARELGPRGLLTTWWCRA
ncbi:hypothetical protein WME95_38175 [Sorangium sp. So ce327]|uniref:hypothetical protein n=1 Tax=Sorangium sp. So ce327 TaxID=3133301 RepID=UPI003F5DDED7